MSHLVPRPFTKGEGRGGGGGGGAGGGGGENYGIVEIYMLNRFKNEYISFCKELKITTRLPL